MRGQRFRLGWWDGVDGREGRYGIDVVGEEGGDRS